MTENKFEQVYNKFNDSNLEGIVDKYSWEFPTEFIYLALVEPKTRPGYVYEHVVPKPDNRQDFYKLHETQDASKLYAEMKAFYNLEWEKGF